MKVTLLRKDSLIMDDEQIETEYNGASDAEVEIYYATTYSDYEPRFSSNEEEE